MTYSPNLGPKRPGGPFRVCCGLVFLFLTMSSVSARAEAAAVGQIQGAISRQLMAFKNDDYDAAYRYASKEIQSVFSRIEFETMVRTGYPQIDKSRKVSFGDIVLSDDGSRAIALVWITGMDRTTLNARYLMILEDGAWKNNGVINLEVITPV